MQEEILRPSQLQQFAACPGSYRMQLGIPEETSPDAEEGTRLHRAVATGDTEGLDAEQLDLVERCKAFLVSLVESTGLDHVTYEQPLVVSGLDGTELTRGTADIVAFSPSRPESCAIIDWKFGRVAVEDTATNLQLAAYALGAMQLTGADTCEAHIYQPRLGRHVSHTFRSPEAIAANIRAVVRAATSGPMVLNPGEAQCRYCRAKADCPALRRQSDALAVACAEGSALTDPATLAKWYEAAQTAKLLVARVESAMREYLDQHGECAGYRWQEVAGRREVDDICHAAIQFSDIITNSEFLSCCSVSVSQLESAVCDRLQAQAVAAGGKLSRAEAKRRFSEMSEGVVRRGDPSRKIVKSKEV